jgi:hypothetical protein
MLESEVEGEGVANVGDLKLILVICSALALRQSKAASLVI